MYCPNCGRETNDNSKFCISCGTNMQIVKQAMTGKPSTNPAAAVQWQIPSEYLQESKYPKFKRTGLMVTMIGFLGTIVSAIICAALSEIFPSISSAMAAIPALFAVSFIFFGPMIMLYGRIVHKHKDPRVMVVPMGAQLAPMVDNKKSDQQVYNFEAYRMPPRSIVDPTTKQLRMPVAASMTME